MPAPLWKPGVAPYALWLNNLRENDPEGYKQHLLERKVRKSMKQAMKETVEAQQAQWIELFNTGAITLMEKAINDGDVQAFTAIYDRFVGKPDSAVDITSNGNTLQAPTIIFKTRQIDDWKDIDSDEV